MESMMKLSTTYRKVFEQDCIGLIINAYEIAKAEKKYRLDWYENDFSELLCHYVNESPLSSNIGITCKTENRLFSEKTNQVKGYADKLPRIDFVYFKIWKTQRFYCYMEAKRLKERDSNLKKAYIDEGIDRFISEKYPAGCMLGYLLEGNLDETIKGINSLLEKYKRSSEYLYPKPNILFRFCYESYHSEIGILKHLIFNFTVL